MAIIIPSRSNYGISNNKKPATNSIHRFEYNEGTYKISEDEGFISHFDTLSAYQEYELTKELPRRLSFKFRLCSHLYTSDAYELKTPDYLNNGKWFVKEFISDKSKANFVIDCTVKKGNVKFELGNTSDVIDWNSVVISETETYTLTDFNFETTFEANEQLSIKITITPDGIKDQQFILADYGDFAHGIYPYFLEASNNSRFKYQRNIKLEVVCTDPDSQGNHAYMCIELDVRHVYIDIYGRYSYVDKISSQETFVSSLSENNEIVNLNNNELFQSTNSPTLYEMLEKTLEEYKYGKETLNLLCSIDDYYTIEGSKVISKDGSIDKMNFDLYDEVIPFITDSNFNDVPLSSKEGKAKKFAVLGVTMIYDGSVRQKLQLQEKDIDDLTIIINGVKYEYEYGFVCGGVEEKSTIKDVIIASSINTSIGNATIKRIKNNAFRYNNIIESVKMPNTIVEIAPLGFSYCQNLEEVYLSSQINKIPSQAFDSCISLDTILIPKSVTSIETNAFAECETLVKVLYTGNEAEWNKIKLEDGNYKLSEALKYYYSDFYPIEEGNFWHFVNGVPTIWVTPSEKYLEFAPDTELFGDHNGYEVSNLINKNIGVVNVPSTYDGKTVKGIGLEAFMDAKNITEIILPDTVTYFNAYAFKNCSSLKKINIPKGVTTIGERAFEGCSKLKHIELPSSLVMLINGIFNSCTNLESINVASDNSYFVSYKGNLYSRDQYSFILDEYARGKKDTSFDIPFGVDTLSLDCMNGAKNLKYVTLPKTIEDIHQRVFYLCDNLKALYYVGTEEEFNTIDITESGNEILKNIPIYYMQFKYVKDEYGYNLLSGVSNNDVGEYLSLGDGHEKDLMVIGMSENCNFQNVKDTIKELRIPLTYSRISASAFENFTKLDKVIFESRYLDIAPNAFNNCPSIKDVYFAGDENDWKNSSFATGNDALLNATIHFNA